MDKVHSALYEMHRCACSTRTLERFVWDVAGIRLRQHRAQAFIQHRLDRKSFGHFGSLRQTTAAATSSGHDTFVPFARQLADSKVEEEAVQSKGGEHGGSTNEESTGWQEDGWHAEIETLAPTESELALHTNYPTADLAGALDEMAGQRGDGSEVTSLVSAPETETIEDTSTAPSSGVPQERRSGGEAGTRGQSRLARKQRRMQAGSFKPSALLRESGDNESQTSTSDVLSIIESMDGPGLSSPPRVTEAAATKAREGVHKKARILKKLGKTESHTKQNPAALPARGKREPWQVQKAALTAKFGEATWSPRKRLSPDTLDGIRALHASDSSAYDTATLSQQFAISPENIRRILRSKWAPSDEERKERAERWERRGVRKWTAMAEGGERPPKKWRELGVGSVKGKPEARPAWKQSGGRSRQKDEEAFVDQEDTAIASLNARIL